jgi:hypothetical protein
MTTTSYSQSNLYATCSKAWYYKYIEKLDNGEEGIALSFGSAIDEAVTALLRKKGNHKTVFSDRFFSSINRKKELVPIFDSKVISYGDKDFDEYVLSPSDIETLQTWNKELSTGNSKTDVVELVKALQKVKKNPYKKIKENEQKFLNRASWLSLKRKGEIILDAFEDQFLPLVEEVIEVQKHAYLKDDHTGDAITGYIDFILRIKGYDKPVIFDLKTSASLYKQEQIDVSDQLTLYAALEGAKYDTDLVGYVVCVKNIKKVDVSYCNTCGHKKDGSHKTCNNTKVNPDTDSQKEVRCNGDWNIKTILQPEVQVMVQKKTEHQLNSILLDQSNIIEGMKQEIVFKNTSKCNNFYGQRCMYYDLCHTGVPTGLKKKGS